MTMKIMIILPNEAWKLISEYKNQGVTHFMLYCIHQCRVNEVSGIKVITKANNTQALPASRLLSQTLPPLMQQLPPIFHFKHYLTYVAVAL